MLLRLVWLKECWLGTQSLRPGWSLSKVWTGLEQKRTCSSPHHLIIRACLPGLETGTHHHQSFYDVYLDQDFWFLGNRPTCGVPSWYVCRWYVVNTRRGNIHVKGNFIIHMFRGNDLGWLIWFWQRILSFWWRIGGSSWFHETDIICSVFAWFPDTDVRWSDIEDCVSFLESPEIWKRLFFNINVMING